MKLPTLPEVRKFLGSLVAVAGAIVGLGVSNNIAHIVGIVSAVAASLLVYLAKNEPAPPPAPEAGLGEIGIIVVSVLVGVAVVIIWAAGWGLPTHH